MNPREQQQVKTRRVFYVPGYDPIHPRRYRELYRKESAVQAGISGYTVDLKPKATDGPYGWRVDARMDDQPVQAHIEVLVWSDIVRGSMSNTIAATYGQLVRTAWVYIASGALWRLMKLRKGPVIAALYPVGMLLVQLALAVFVWWLCLRGTVAAGQLLGLPMLLLMTVGTVFGALAGYASLRWFKHKDSKFFA